MHGQCLLAYHKRFGNLVLEIFCGLGQQQEYISAGNSVQGQENVNYEGARFATS